MMALSTVLLVDAARATVHVANDPVFGADTWEIRTVTGSHVAYPAGISSTVPTLSFTCQPGTRTVPLGWPGTVSVPLALAANTDYTIRIHHYGTNHAAPQPPLAEFFIHTASLDGTIPSQTGNPADVPFSKRTGFPPPDGGQQAAPAERRHWVVGFDPYHQRFALWAKDRAFLFDPSTEDFDELTIGTYGMALCATTRTGPGAYLITGQAQGLVQMTLDPGGLQAAWEYGCPSIVRPGRSTRVRRLLPQLTGSVMAALTIDGASIDATSRTMVTSVPERYGPDAFGERVDIDLEGAAGAKLRSLVADTSVRRG